MRKLVNLCKKPFLITSVILTVVALVALIVVCCVPHGGTYTYSKTEDGVKEEMILEFKGDKIETTYKMDGEKMPMGEPTEYKIKDGKLYQVYSMGEESMEMEVGKINSFKIVAGEGDNAQTLTCGLNMGIMIASAIVAGLGALMTAFCVTVTILDRKGKINA